MKPLPVTLRTLLTTKEGIRNTLIFLKNTRIATRKWILGDREEGEEGEGEWGDIEREK